jgi:feruloyl esterase
MQNQATKFLRPLLFCFAFALFVRWAGAQAAEPSPPATAAAACASLTSAANAQKFSRISDAVTSVFSAGIVPAHRDIPETCRVEGSVAPSVGFLLYLPTSDWNGKFMEIGCGGACGSFLPFRVEPPLVRHYAVVTSDLGHKGWAGDFSFAYNDLAAEMDFGWRATHVTAIAAKELVAAFYERKAARNYYMGCSTGGRQGLIEAQQFPTDFEGIIAGAPPLDQTGDSALHLNWIMRSNVGKDGTAILKADRLPLIHAAVLAACDAKDGLKDGVLQDPRTCNWDPASIACAAGATSTASCLTADEVTVVRKIYSGATNSHGDKLYFGMPRGSEDQWPMLIAVGSPPGMGAIGDSMIRYGSFFDQPAPGVMEFDYDRDPQRLAMMERLYNAQNPDLRKFKAAGGKMISFHGWNDNNIPAGASIDYYETTTRTMGGEAATRDFYRLFVLPSVDHCQYGLGGGEVDWITALENWVEKGEAPDQVIAHHMIKEPYDLIPGDIWAQMARHPLDPSTFDRTRPVYPFPDVARWSGKGDPDKAENWVKAARPKAP